MPQNSISIPKLHPRCTTIRNLLRPVLRSRDIRTEQLPRVTRRREATVTAWDITNGDSYRDWFFRTPCRAIWGQYFEEWTTNADETVWHLSQTCLHLFHVETPRVPVEIFALHCEPKETGDSFQASLRRGPHVHIRSDNNRLGHAHIPLNLGHIDAVLESCETLTIALRASIQLIAEEVIEQSNRNSLFKVNE